MLCRRRTKQYSSEGTHIERCLPCRLQCRRFQLGVNSFICGHCSSKATLESSLKSVRVHSASSCYLSVIDRRAISLNASIVSRLHLCVRLRCPMKEPNSGDSLEQDRKRLLSKCDNEPSAGTTEKLIFIARAISH